MKTFNLLTIALVAIFMTGCLSTPVPYKKESITSNLKNDLVKVKNSSVTVICPDSRLAKKPTSVTGGATTLDIDTGTINREVAKEFFKQYFNNVNISKKETNIPSGLVIKSYIIDYEYAYGYTESTDFIIKLHVDAFYNNEKLFSKDYKREGDNKILLSLRSSFLLIAVDLKPKAMELFHKLLLEIYEENVKQDLIKSLKNKV